ncbi:hypothetical protein HPP92_015974 [Vanilla planifolia]|uniref:Equilibrative nucleoside transporter n=1 Tax=Vanilla planifolia TaxID=51239 RepID=A0A835QUL0_VANPL|nr:hypothetical protein HPP92_015974 [Vanilla planifolia]
MTYHVDSKEAKKSKGRFGAILVCWFLGIGSLIAWNSMLTIVDYYVKVFPRYHPTRVLSVVYQPFALVTIAILAYHEAKLNTRIRNLFGFSLFFLSSLLVIVLDLATSGKGGVGTFIGVCLISAAFGVADAHVQGGMVGDLAVMQPEFMQSFLAGLAASGALTSALRLITKAAFEHSHDGLRKGAMLFFAVASFLELLGLKTVSADLAAAGVQVQDKQKVCFSLSLFSSFLPLFISSLLFANFRSQYMHLSQAEEDPNQLERLTLRQLLIQNWDYALDLFLIYVLTLSIFPGFLSEDTGKHALGSWYALILITMYNATDLIGRYSPLIPWLRIESRRALMIIILLRFFLIPAFYFTAKYGAQGYMIMLTSLLGITNGHLTVCVLTEAPKGHKGPEANALGNLLVAFLLGGICSGVALDWLWLIGKGW